MKLTEKQQEIFEELFVRYPVLEKNREDILKAYEVLETCYRTGGKLLVAGNGGSCADAEHIVGELMKGFKKRRPLSEELQRRLAMEDTNHGEELARSLQGSLRAIALDGHPGLSTAFANDVDPVLVYAQQVLAYGAPGDLLIGISTSGNAANVAAAVQTARALGIPSIGLTGRDGGRLARLASLALIAPEQETYRIQECHLALYHLLCGAVEYELFDE